jgi:hypothetical protein
MRQQALVVIHRSIFSLSLQELRSLLRTACAETSSSPHDIGNCRAFGNGTRRA